MSNYYWEYRYIATGSPKYQMNFYKTGTSGALCGITISGGMNVYRFTYNNEERFAVIPGFYAYKAIATGESSGSDSYSCMYYIYLVKTRNSPARSDIYHNENGNSDIVRPQDAILQLCPGATNIQGSSFAYLAEYIINTYATIQSDPVYIEATKLKYTDGTYNFIRGAATADRARKAAYKHLLNTYGTFYKATERELAESFAQNLSLLNGGGVTKSYLYSHLYKYDMEVAA